MQPLHATAQTSVFPLAGRSLLENVSVISARDLFLSGYIIDTQLQCL